MRFYLTICFAFLISQDIFAQQRMKSSKNELIRQYTFKSFSIADSKSDSIRILTYLVVPNNVLKFVKNNDLFESSYQAKVFGSEVFSGDRINAMAADRRYLFMATDNDLIQFDIKDKIIEVFNYKFLGNINTLKIDRTRLLIGTSEGIVSYSYK